MSRRKKKNFSCQKSRGTPCGVFKWLVTRDPRTKKWKKFVEAHGTDVYVDRPRRKSDWKRAELFDVSEPCEPIEVTEYSPGDFCRKCRKEMKKQGVF